MLELLRHLNYSIVLFIAQSLFVFVLPRRTKFLLRLVLLSFLYFAVGIFIPDKIGGLDFPFNTFGMFFCLVVGTKYVFDVSFKTALYCSISASLLQHITAHVYSILCFFVDKSITPPQAAVPYLYGISITICYMLSYLSIYMVGYFLFARRNKDIIDVEIKNWKLVIIMSIALIAIYIIWDLALKREESGSLSFNIIYVICCFALLDVLYTANQAEVEEKIMRQLLAEEQAHYNALSSNIDVINRKCHDLKYQIIALQQTSDDAKKNAQLDQLQYDVAIYENLARTGNAALDNTLSEKGMVCENKKIRFYYAVDGKLLSFMEALDIYVLFGNALDNAIECVQKYSGEQKRFICIYTFSQGGIIKIRIENYCEEEVVFVGGIPQTNKPDKLWHGYGVKSMKRIVQKYSGNLTVHWEDNLFYTDILLPLPSQK